MNRRVQRTCLFLYTLNLLAPKIRERPTAWIIKVADRRAAVPSLLLSCISFVAVKLPPPSSPPRYVQRSHLRVVTVELQPLRYRRATVAAMLVEMPQLHRIPSSIWSSEVWSAPSLLVVSRYSHAKHQKLQVQPCQAQSEYSSFQFSQGN